MNNFYINTKVNPKGLKKHKCDVVVIGAGIGGLVCGCYLAKAGMKVMIAEQHDKPGGYCTSFLRRGFTFDSCVHSLGSMRAGGQLDKICTDLALNKKVKFTRSNPSDTIILPEHKIKIMNSFEDTINEFQVKFPKESKSINDLFYFIAKKDFASLYIKLRNKTFQNLLDDYIKDNKLKAILTIPLGNIGLSATMASALVSVILYREFIFNGGYYPLGGMQAFANGIADSFKEYGGELLLSSKVGKILTKGKEVKGVILENGNTIKSKFVISNCDIRQTFLELIGKEKISVKLNKLLVTMTPSTSAFLVYLGVDRSLRNYFKESGNIWYSTTYAVDNIYSNIAHGQVDSFANCVLITSPSSHDVRLAPQNKESVILVFNTPYKTKQYWERERHKIADCLLRRGEDVIENLSKHVLFRDVATPLTLQKYTLNFHGAAYGWAALPSQIAKDLISQRTEIKGLFLAGHWCMRGAGQGGVSTVAVTGRDTAQLILNLIKK